MVGVTITVVDVLGVILQGVPLAGVALLLVLVSVRVSAVVAKGLLLGVVQEAPETHSKALVTSK